ncbi:hypothetical protein ACFSTC_06745 [Nonomuraea ferruginea]
MSGFEPGRDATDAPPDVKVMMTIYDAVTDVQSIIIAGSIGHGRIMTLMQRHRLSALADLLHLLLALHRSLLDRVPGQEISRAR